MRYLKTDVPHQSSAQLSKSWLSLSLSDTHQKLNLILATETMDVGIFTMNISRKLWCLVSGHLNGGPGGLSVKVNLAPAYSYSHSKGLF